MDSLSERSDDKRLQIQKRQSKLVFYLVIVACVVLAIVVFAFLTRAYMNRHYNEYKVVHTMERADSNTVNYVSYNGNLLKYSRDGASALDASGTVLWNGSYEMDSPTVSICGKYLAIADIQGKEVYVYNGKDSGTKIETTLPIVQVSVASQGVVAVMLEDVDSNVINIYNPYSTTDTLLGEIPTNIDDAGFPIDFTMSSDGNSFITAYVALDEADYKSKVCFYNFSEVGQDKNRLVGGKNFDQTMVGKAEFLGDNTACVFTESGFSLFHNMKQPEEIVSKEFEEKIKSVLKSDSHFGFVFENDEEDATRRIVLYDLKGKKILDTRIKYEYDKVYLQEDEIIFYSDLECIILRKNGVEKFHYNFDKNILSLMATKNRNRYFLINDSQVSEIKLTKEK